MRRDPEWKLLGAGLCLIAACSGELPTGATDPATVDDNPFGRPDLVQQRIGAIVMANGVWISGTRQVAAVMATGDADNCALDLIDVDRQTVTALVDDVSRDCVGTFGGLAVAPDGTALYYSAADSTTGAEPRYAVRRFDLADHEITDVVSAPESLAFWLSPDGHHIVYEFGTDVAFHLRDLSTGADTLYGFRGRFSFSPDGSQLVFAETINPADPTSRQLRTLNLRTGATQVIGLPLHDGDQFEWTPNGIQYVARTCSAALCGELVNVTTGARLGLHQDDAIMAWSADGRYAAGWGLWGGLAPDRPELATGDWQTHQATVIARENCAFPGGVVISPDGRNVVYGVCSGTYVWTRP